MKHHWPASPYVPLGTIKMLPETHPHLIVALAVIVLALMLLPIVMTYGATQGWFRPRKK